MVITASRVTFLPIKFSKIYGMNGVSSGIVLSYGKRGPRLWILSNETSIIVL